MKTEPIVLEPHTPRISVCKVTDYVNIDLTQPFCFTRATDEERMLVFPETLVSGNTTGRMTGGRIFASSDSLVFL